MPAIFGPSSIVPRKNVKVLADQPEKFNAGLQKWFTHPTVVEVGEFAFLPNDRFKLSGTVRFENGSAALTFTVNGDGYITGLMIADRSAHLANDVEEVLSGIAAEKLGLSFAMRPQPATIEVVTRKSGGSKTAAHMALMDRDPQGHEGETLFDTWIRQRVPAEQVIWVNARQESREPYDFRLGSSILVDVKAVRHHAVRVYASSSERDLVARGRLHIAVVRLVHQDVTVYEQRDGALHQVAQDEFLGRIRMA